MKLETWLARHKLPLGIALLAVALLIYPLGQAAAYAVALALLFCCALLPMPYVAALYVVLFCFDPVLPFPALGGSLVRVMQGGMALRLAWEMWKARSRPSWGELLALALGLLFLAVGYLRYGLEGDALSFIVNLLLFLMLRHVLGSRPEELPDTLTLLLRALTLSVLLALLFGLVYRRFLLAPAGGVTLARFMGTYEPNFMAMFANVALAGLLCLPPRGRWWDALVVGLLVAVVLLTYSLTGYFALVVVWLSLLIRRVSRKTTFLRMLRGALVGIPLFVLLTMAVPYLLRAAPPTTPEPAEVLTTEAPAEVAPAESTPQEVIPQETTPQEAVALSPDPNDLVLLPEEYAAARDAGLEPQPYRRPLSLITPVMTLRAQQQAEMEQEGGTMTARLREVLWCLRTGNLDLLTSGRLGLWEQRLQDFAALPWLNKLLGAGPASRQTYMPLAYTMTYSHNSYLDLLYSFGILGTALILWYAISTLVKKRAMGVALSGPIARAWTFCRISLLLQLLGISMLLNRMVVFFFL